MMRTFWFAITVVIGICFFSAAVDWLAHPVPAAAMSEPAANAPLEEAPQAQSLNGSAPAIQIAVAAVLGLFGVLTMATLLEEKESR
jgi:hypothetical protein